MSNPKKIYFVADGDYSDYHVCGVYSTKELAEKAREWFNASNIEEWNIDAELAGPPGLLRFLVAMDERGNAETTRRSGKYFPDRECAPYGDNLRVAFDVWARDETHAVKIANERRVALIASGEWTTNWDAWEKTR